MHEPAEVRPAGTGPAESFSGVSEAMAAVTAGLAFLASADAGSLPAQALADCLRALGRAESMHVAVRSRFLGAFAAQAGCEADGQPTAKSWLRWQTRISSAAAGGAVGWMRRLAGHARIAASLAAGEISESWARQLCEWTGKLPPDVRDDADGILLTAAAGGADLADLAGLAQEMYERTAGPDEDRHERGQADADDGFADRRVQLDLHFRGAGRLDGDLTPECAAALTAVLDSLGRKAGPEDDRTDAQRRHDALEEACRRLAGSGTLPDTAGQPTLIQLHATLDQLRGMAAPGQAGLSGTEPAGAFLAGRAGADGQAGWLLSRAAAEAYACDARIAPVISGHVGPAVLDAVLSGSDAALSGSAPPGTAGASAAATAERLRDTAVRYALDILSGPAGLAAQLRSALPGCFGAAVSLPLDVGAPTATIPPHLRRAVTARDRHCAFPGCRQRPAACQVHHVIPRAEGGVTALRNLVLLCSFHHLTVVHRWGWRLVLHGDGTTKATSPDGRRTFLSHSRPPQDGTGPGHQPRMASCREDST